MEHKACSAAFLRSDHGSKSSLLIGVGQSTCSELSGMHCGMQVCSRSVAFAAEFDATSCTTTSEPETIRHERCARDNALSVLFRCTSTLIWGSVARPAACQNCQSDAQMTRILVIKQVPRHVAPDPETPKTRSRASLWVPVFSLHPCPRHACLRPPFWAACARGRACSLSLDIGACPKFTKFTHLHEFGTYHMV